MGALEYGHRLTPLLLVLLQAGLMVAVLCYYTEKQPVLAYTTSFSFVDTVRVFNESSFTVFFNDNTFTKYSGAVLQSQPSAHGQLDRASLNDAHSHVTVSVMSPFFMFMTVSITALGFGVTTLRLMENGQINGDTQYGENVTETMGWETCFWIYVAMQHMLVLSVMSSPGDINYTCFQSAAVALSLCAFCSVSCAAQSDHSLRRIEAPILIVMCVCYVFFMSNTKIIVSHHFTYMIWTAYLGLDILLMLGHTWDSPVLNTTVINCRWTYSVLCGLTNVALYVAY